MVQDLEMELIFIGNEERFALGIDKFNLTLINDKIKNLNKSVELKQKSGLRLKKNFISIVYNL